MYRIDLLTFVDFVLASGVDKIRRAEPHKNPLLRDFWGPWRAAIRVGVEVGDLGDDRKARIYPVHTAGYRAAIEAARAERWNLGQPNALTFGELTVDVQPDVSLLVERKPVDVWCHHGVGGGPCSAERGALILAGAKLAGFVAAVVDVSPKGARRLVREDRQASSASDVALLFKAEAAAFLLFRRHAEARAK